VDPKTLFIFGGLATFGMHVVIGVYLSGFARKKGWMPVFGFFIGLIFGFIGVIVFLFLPELKNDDEKAAAKVTAAESGLEGEESAERTCAYCGERVHFYEGFCPNCGRREQRG
jgi:hypothetical protein